MELLSTFSHIFSKNSESFAVGKSENREYNPRGRHAPFELASCRIERTFQCVKHSKSAKATIRMMDSIY